MHVVLHAALPYTSPIRCRLQPCGVPVVAKAVQSDRQLLFDRGLMRRVRVVDKDGIVFDTSDQFVEGVRVHTKILAEVGRITVFETQKDVMQVRLGGSL